jgi:uncharacterized protein DUF4129
MTMDTRRPQKTSADYLVIAVSPVLIMLLVGSLSFFLVEVFYRGAAVNSVRWVMFWFVFAVVLLARLGIEYGSTRAAAYGFVLALVTSLYLSRIHPAYFLGLALLAIVWWCANRLTRDCTLIDDDADASGSGLLEKTSELEPPRPGPEPLVEKTRSTAPHAPGRWLIYFSLAALPLFGVGQMLLPDAAARRTAFELLAVYLAAALALLLTTSFLGLRRYLRQRRLSMPGTIAFGWVSFGVSVAGLVLAAALLLPRPGAGETWLALRYRIDYHLQQASQWAASFNPSGKGEGQPGRQPSSGNQTGNGQANGPEQRNSPTSTAQGPAAPSNQSGNSAPNPQTSSSAVSTRAVQSWHRLFRVLLVLAAVSVLCVWLARHRRSIAQAVRSIMEALAQFFRQLFGFRSAAKSRAAGRAEPAPQKRRAFAAFENPFVTGRDRTWPPEQLILYSYEAVQTWAAERGSPPQPQQTAREFCRALGEKFPEVGAQLSQLSFLYGHVAYDLKAPEPCDLRSVQQLWHFLTVPAQG